MRGESSSREEKRKRQAILSCKYSARYCRHAAAAAPCCPQPVCFYATNHAIRHENCRMPVVRLEAHKRALGRSSVIVAAAIIYSAARSQRSFIWKCCYGISACEPAAAASEPRLSRHYAITPLLPCHTYAVTLYAALRQRLRCASKPAA